VVLQPVRLKDKNTMGDEKTMTDSQQKVMPVIPSSYKSRALDLRDVVLTDGFWHKRQRQNTEVVLDHADSWIEKLGWYDAFVAAAGGEPKRPLQGKLFTDADVYKTLEAMIWEVASRPDPKREARIMEIAHLIAGAQEPDGYVNTFFGIKGREFRYSDVAHGHELYCGGHFFQAAVARIRSGKNDILTQTAIRFADRICEDFGVGGIEGSDGHPEIEVAMMELYRATGDKKYLAQAKRFIDGRGYKTFEQHAIGHEYYSDDMPVREATIFRGHVVRALYFAAGVVDLAVETNDLELLNALELQWANTWAKRTYITGGMGSRHLGESFGEDFELSPERAYTETCGSISAIMVAWRLLLATNNSHYGDAIERLLYNMVATHPSEDGTRFFYANPLQKREPGIYAEPGEAPFRKDTLRAEWFWVSCCPTNYVRLLASLSGYMATTSHSEVRIHQFFTGEIKTTTEDGKSIELAIETNYPWDGEIKVQFKNSPGNINVALRVPEWAHGATLTFDGDVQQASPGYAEIRRDFKVNDTITLNLPMKIRVLKPDTRINAIRDTVAIERGPLLFCAEELESDASRVDLDNFIIDLNQEIEEINAVGPSDAVKSIRVSGEFLSKEDERLWPYDGNKKSRERVKAEIELIPYYAWSNRGFSTMRVWIPFHEDTK